MIRLIGVLAFVVILLSDSLAEEFEELEEIVIGHYRIDWRSYPVFYVEASPEIAGSMNEAVRAVASEQPKLCWTKADTAWICEEITYRYFVGVLGDGTETLSGFVCGESLGVPRLKYYREGLVAFSPCVELFWDDDIRQYDVSEAEADDT
jgi:hypothetical protein